MNEMAKKEKQTYPRTRKEMLRIMRAADKKGQLLEMVLEEFAKHPFSMPALWDCRDYIFSIKREDYVNNPVLITYLALLCAMAGRLDDAKEYVAILGKTPRNWQLQDFDPSILNGFRDFTRFGPCLERYKDTITEAIGKLYGSGGKGVYEIALAEWYYQNNNCFHALVLVTGTIPLMEQENDMRCLFVALALQMKILLVNGQARTAKPLVEKIRKRIYETGWEELTSSLNALECLAACYDGRQEDVEEWLEKTAPDENNDIFMMDMYAYLVKVRCYLQTGKYMVAHVLVKQLIALLTPGNRHMDLCECYMLSAIICHKAGDNKHLIEELTKTLELAGKFGYIRLLADEGNSMVQMLNIYQQEKGADELTDQIKLLADEVGRYFPDYLKSPAEYFEPLTATETSVLRLMSQGLSNDEIAGRLGKKTGTVKFHTNNIFRKLQVQNRQQAVNRGREINLL